MGGELDLIAGVRRSRSAEPPRLAGGEWRGWRPEDYRRQALPRLASLLGLTAY